MAKKKTSKKKKVPARKKAPATRKARRAGASWAPSPRPVVAKGSAPPLRLQDPRALALEPAVEVSSLAFTLDGSVLLAITTDATLRSWDVATGAARAAIPVGAGASFVAAQADGAALVLGQDHCLHSVDLATGVERRWGANRTRVPYRAVSADGRLAATVGVDSSIVVLWDLVARAKLRTLERHKFGLDDVTLSADGSVAVSIGWYDFRVRCWSTTRGTQAWEEPRGNRNRALLSPDGTELLLAPGVVCRPTQRGAAPRWERPELERPLRWAWSIDAARIALLHAPRVELLDAATGATLESCAAPDGDAFTALAVSPDGRHLAVGTKRGTILLFAAG